MPRNKLDILQKLADEKSAFIIQRIEALEQLIQSASFILFDQITEDFLDKLKTDDNDALENDAANVRKISLLDQVWQRFEQSGQLTIINAFVHDLKEIMDLGKQYYTTLIPNQVASAEIENILNQKLGIKWNGKEWASTKGGYIDSLLSDESLKLQAKQIAFNSIIAKSGPSALRKELKSFVSGTTESKSELLNYFDQFAFDTYSQIDRLNSKMHAERLDLKYFLYNGGTVKDSRVFCVERHGKCFSEAEAETWKDLIGTTTTKQGKTKMIRVPAGPIVEDKATYNPIRDLGGIRCRHSADFVSEEIALELRQH